MKSRTSSINWNANPWTWEKVKVKGQPDKIYRQEKRLNKEKTADITSVSFPLFLAFDSLPAGPSFLARSHLFANFVFHKTLVYQHKKQRSPSLSIKHFIQKYLEKENFKNRGMSLCIIMYPEAIATTTGSETTVPHIILQMCCCHLRDIAGTSRGIHSAYSLIVPSIKIMSFWTIAWKLK